MITAAAFAQTTVLRVGGLIDPAAGTIARNQVILVKDGKIAEVGPKVNIPAGAEVIDLTNAWVMPGLMDAHTRIPPEQGRFWLFEYIDADDKDEVRKAVRQNIYYGADAIKLVADNGAFYYTVEEIRAAVEESHAAGRPVSVHVMGGEAARNVILGGADSIEHGFDLSDELLRLMKEKGTWLVGAEFPQAHLSGCVCSP
jgi:imidazolonepropionase-like amidohydrolase